MNAFQYDDAVVNRFLDKVALPDEDHLESACWLWQGAKHGEGRGYGKFWLDGKTVSAHKASHLIFNGPVDEGLVVGHICNNECCASPYHLVACTQTDNILYSVACGRHNSCKR
jgi:hypothetical protein